MVSSLSDSSRDWLHGIEHAVFDPREWAIQTLTDRLIESPRRDPDNTAKYGQAAAVNQQFRLLLTYQRQWDPAPSVVTAYEQVYELTRGMAHELGLDLADMDRYLLTVAVEQDQGWSMDVLLPRCRRLLNDRAQNGAEPTGWLLTSAASRHNFNAMRRLLAAGARWAPDGKKVLTELPCDHPDHPLLDSRHEAWWAVLYNDDRAWCALTTDLVKDEFFAQLGDQIEQARAKLGPEAGWFMDFFTDMGLSNARQLERFREPGVDAAAQPGHRWPSREVLLAEVVLSPRPMTVEAWAFLAELGIEPSPAEQEALMTLRLRKRRPLNDLPWSPEVHRGRALWALLDEARWNESSNTPGWNALGQILIERATVLQSLAERDGVNPVQRWWETVVRERTTTHWYGGSKVSEQIASMTSTLDRLFDGLDQMEAVFPDTPLDREPWVGRLNDWMIRCLTKEQANPQAAEERELRMVDLSERITGWGARRPAVARPILVRPRL